MDSAFRVVKVMLSPCRYLGCYGFYDLLDTMVVAVFAGLPPVSLNWLALLRRVNRDTRIREP